MKTTRTKYIVLRNSIGNYLAVFHCGRTGLVWQVTPHVQIAINFDGNPHVLFTAKQKFKSPEWKVITGTLTWTEK